MNQLRGISEYGWSATLDKSVAEFVRIQLWVDVGKLNSHEFSYAPLIPCPRAQRRLCPNLPQAKVKLGATDGREATATTACSSPGGSPGEPRSRRDRFAHRHHSRRQRHVGQRPH